ncbi:hypothetical protein KC865_01465 [Candidatus Kaiserbacteria bacterium]|nr:hypothetical protein [Candidatus Kaiserbacteria bacterium]USN92626.1 MAG: hypothetical protein H6782_02330 [Candidatus Nomurabacteria bacterium]
MRLFLVTFGFFIVSPTLAFAKVPDIYTNENYINSTHDEPATFYLDGWGGFYGTTISGRLFTQKPVTNTEGVRLHKFQIDQAYYYVSDKGTIWAGSDLEALSIYWTLV